MTQPGWVKFQHFFKEDQSLGLFSASVVTGGAVSSSWGRRSGDWGCRMFSSGAFLEALTEDLTHFVVGFCYQCKSDTRSVLYEGREGTTVHVTVTREVGGAVAFWRGDTSTGTILATSAAGVYPLNVDVFVAVEATIDNATGAFEVWIEGDSKIDDSGVDTQNGGTAVVNRHRHYGTGGGSDNSIKDLYVGDMSMPGAHVMHDWRGQWLAPTSDVIANFIRSTGASNFGTVDELPYSSTDKNTSAVSGDRDRYGHAAGSFSYPIVTLAVVAQLAKDSGSASVKIGLYSGGNIEQSAAIVLSTTPSVHSLIITEEPVSGDPLDSTIRDAINSDVENVT